MYLDHFGLTEAPFRITPHTEFFFAGANRGPTLDALIYAIMNDEGIVKVSGEVGSGKTMLCRVLMERLPESVVMVYLANPSLSRNDILFALADELHLPLPEQSRNTAIVRLLQEHLVRLYGDGKRVVVLVDEAHAMPVETLEEIRLLSNLESNQHKLLQLVLFGQPELNDVLARSDMRQLKERITHNFQLEPLIRTDVAEYIEFRLRAAGYKGPNPFTTAAAKLIADSSQGLTRRINILADKSLLAAFSAGGHEVGPKQAKAAIADCDFSEATTLRARPKGPRFHPAMLVGAIAVIVLVAYFLGRASTGSAPMEKPLPSETQPPTLSPSSEEKSGPIAHTIVSSSSPLVPAPVDLTEERLVSSLPWLKETPGERWFLQLQSVDASQKAQVEEYLRAFKASGGDYSQVRVYRSALSGRLRYGITYGDFGSMNEARAAADTLPPAVRSGHPFPRQVRQLR